MRAGGQYEPENLKGAFYNLDDPRIFQVYVAPQSNDKIPYGAPSNDRLKPADLQLAMTVPCEKIPDPRKVIEDAADLEKEERDRALRAKKEEELEAIRRAEKEVQMAEQQKIKQGLIEAKPDIEDDSQALDGDEGEDKSGEESGQDEGEGDEEEPEDEEYPSGEDSDSSDDMGELPS